MHAKHLLTMGALLFTVLEAAPLDGPIDEDDMTLYEHDKRGEDAIMLYEHDKEKRGKDAVMLHEHDKQKRGEDEVMVLYDYDHRSFNADFADK